ncbi:MAG: acetyl transferase, partial [Streptococcus mitis]|nr:acetyl transferase [Streptococcus mitis]
QCVIPGQEHLPELAIMSDPLNTFDIMAWLKKVAMLFKYQLLRYSM